MCDLYRYFQTSYYKEVEDQKKVKGKMDVQEHELLMAQDDKRAAQGAEKKADEALTQAVKEHYVVLAQKDDEIHLLREQIAEAKTHELEAVKEYRKSMDFVS